MKETLKDLIRWICDYPPPTFLIVVYDSEGRDIYKKWVTGVGPHVCDLLVEVHPITKEPV